MNLRSMLLAAGLAGASAAAAVAQDAPRQLSTPPTVADTVRRSAAAPAQAQPAPEQAAPPQQAPQPRYRIGLKSGQVYAADDVELRQPVIGRSYLLLNGQQREVEVYERVRQMAAYYEAPEGFHEWIDLMQKLAREGLAAAGT